MPNPYIVARLGGNKYVWNLILKTNSFEIRSGGNLHSKTFFVISFVNQMSKHNSSTPKTL